MLQIGGRSNGWMGRPEKGRLAGYTVRLILEWSDYSSWRWTALCVHTSKLMRAGTGLIRSADDW